MLRVLVCFGALLGVDGSNAKGAQFLEENKHKDGVVTLPSGLQ